MSRPKKVLLPVTPLVSEEVDEVTSDGPENTIRILKQCSRAQIDKLVGDWEFKSQILLRELRLEEEAEGIARLDKLRQTKIPQAEYETEYAKEWEHRSKLRSDKVKPVKYVLALTKFLRGHNWTLAEYLRLEVTKDV